MVSETALHHPLGLEGSFRGPDLKLYLRDVRDALSKKRPFEVKSWGTVKDAKDAIQRLLKIPVHAQRLYFGPLLSSGKELPNYRTLVDAGIYRSGEVLLLDICPENGSGSSLLSGTESLTHSLVVSTSLLNSTHKSLQNTIQIARRAFALGIKPDLVMDGSGGSYYIHDPKKNKIAVFKPADEEPYAENNPRGYLPASGGGDEFLRQGIAPGEACIREVAAYLLDHNGMASVPLTTLCEARHPAFNTNGARLNVSQGGASIGAHSISSPLHANSPHSGKQPAEKKVGSFQEFVRSEGSMDDLSPSKLSVAQVHKIAILDIRILNADRNAANLLVRRLPDNSLELIPIDHGYCLRSMCDVSWMDWCWLDWPQLKQPISKEHQEYIEKLDIEADARMLSERLNICEEAIDYFRASTSLLKAGVRAGLTLYDIACMCCRNDNLAEQPSLLEHLTSLACELSQIAVTNEDWHHGAACQALEEQLSPKRPSAIKSRDRSNQCRFKRCASSGEFLSLQKPEESQQISTVTTTKNGLSRNNRSNLSMAMEEATATPPAPSLMLASGSDSSSDNGKPDVAEGEDEQIEQWAHSIIHDSFQHVIPQVDTSRTGRSGSLSSSDDGSLSCSPKGFWVVPPGSVDDASFEEGEEDASVLSFGTSPSDDMSGFQSPPTLPLPSTKKRQPSVTFADPPTSGHAKATGTAAFSSQHLPSSGPFLRPPAMVSVVQQEKHSSALVKTTQPVVQRQESTASSTTGMTRSKSYTALSRSFSSNVSSSSRTPVVHRAESMDAAEDEFVRAYFLKFIDLVIRREMARRVRQSAAAKA